MIFDALISELEDGSCRRQHDPSLQSLVAKAFITMDGLLRNRPAAQGEQIGQS
jgi:hypothetical protein